MLVGELHYCEYLCGGRDRLFISLVLHHQSVRVLCIYCMVTRSTRLTVIDPVMPVSSQMLTGCTIQKVLLPMKLPTSSFHAFENRSVAPFFVRRFPLVLALACKHSPEIYWILLSCVTTLYIVCYFPVQSVTTSPLNIDSTHLVCCRKPTW